MPNFENKTDERLLWVKFLDGDDQVLSSIYLEHSHSLFDYGCRFTNDRDLVKDCIQEVFCNLIKMRSRLSETDNIKFYLLTSTKREIIRALKKSSKKIYAEDDFDYSFELLLNKNIDQQDAEFDEGKQVALAVALGMLTDRQKEAIYLRFNKGLEYDEISAILNLNYQSSRALIHRAIEKLRSLIRLEEAKFTQVLLSMFTSNNKSVI